MSSINRPPVFAGDHADTPDREHEEQRVAAMRKKEEAIRLRELGVDTGGFKRPSKKEIAANQKSKQGVRTSKTGSRRTKYVPDPDKDKGKKKKQILGNIIHDIQLTLYACPVKAIIYKAISKTNCQPFIQTINKASNFF